DGGVDGAPRPVRVLVDALALERCGRWGAVTSGAAEVSGQAPRAGQAGGDAAERVRLVARHRGPSWHARPATPPRGQARWATAPATTAKLSATASAALTLRHPSNDR